MTTLYRINATRTRKIIHDFIKFRDSANSSHPLFRNLMFGAVFITIGNITTDKLSVRITFFILGLLFILFGLLRNALLTRRTLSRDPYYINQIPIEIIFTTKEFQVCAEGEPTKYFSYHSITYLFEDTDNYYININDEDLQVLPKAAFITGDPVNFKTFIENKSKKSTLPVNITFKQHMENFKTAWKNR